MSGRFSVEAIFSARDHMTAPIRRMHDSLSKFAAGAKKELGELDAINSKLVGGMNKIGAAALAAGAAAATGLYAAAKPGMEFEQQMADLGASFMKTRGEIGGLEEKALELGAATKFSATEVAGAMEAMSQAGFDEQQALNGVAGMTYAAAAAGEDLIATTETISAVMKGMQIDVAKSGEVADVLALASVKTASSISSLGESLSKAGPVAQQFGIDLKDTTAMVALLQDAGIDASEAGSSVATMLTKLATPTDAVKSKMKKLGISFQDASGNMKPASDVLEQFTKASKKSGGNMKQAAFFAELLGLRGQKAGILLEKALANGKYADLVTELKEAEGTAKKMADLRMNTLTGDIDVFTENVKGLAIELFSMNSGPLRDVVQGMTSWLEANKDVIVQELQDGIKMLVDNLPEIWKWTKRIGTAWLVFNGFAAGVKVAQTGIAAYELVSKLAGGTNVIFEKSVKGVGKAVDIGSKVLKGGAEMFGLFNEQAAKASGKSGLGGLREGLNAGELSKQINGVTSSLGKAGLLGAAALVGYEFGTWLNDTLKLDEKINDIIDDMAAIGKIAAPKQTKRDEKTGEIIEYGRPSDTIAKNEARKSFLENEDKMKGIFATPESRRKAGFSIKQQRDYEAMQDRYHAGEQGYVPHAMVTPQERTAKTINENTTTERSELVIKDQTGRAELTKKPKARHSSIKLQPTGVP